MLHPSLESQKIHISFHEPPIVKERTVKRVVEQTHVVQQVDLSPILERLDKIEANLEKCMELIDIKKEILDANLRVIQLFEQRLTEKNKSV